MEISVAVSYLVHYDTLSQNAADIAAKYDGYFITKCDSLIAKYGSYYKMRR